MKKHFITVILVAFSICLYAQESYKYIIIPTYSSEIGKGLNPYGISSSIQKILNEKSIANKFQTDQIPDDYCEALILELHNNSNMFKNRLGIELKDCNNRVIWKGEGMGQSKEYAKGYAEAAADALEGLKEMPEMERRGTYSRAVKKEEPLTMVAPVRQKQTGRIYKPSNLYYNYTYFTDLVEKDQGTIELIIINGKLLGYNDDLESIAVLTPSEQNSEYAISWKNANGEKTSGIATLTGQELKITLSDGGQIKTIILQKY